MPTRVMAWLAALVCSGRANLHSRAVRPVCWSSSPEAVAHRRVRPNVIRATVPAQRGCHHGPFRPSSPHIFRNRPLTGVDIRRGALDNDLRQTLNGVERRRRHVTCCQNGNRRVRWSGGVTNCTTGLRMKSAVNTAEFVSAKGARTTIIGYVPFNPMVVGCSLRRRPSDSAGFCNTL